MPVYCGLAATRQRLLCAVVDDAGRLLATQEVNDEAAGYGALCVLLTDRSGEDNCGHVPIATDSETRLVPLLLAAAGRQLAVAEPELVERYARDEPAGAAEPLRRAVGMARALQAGTLTAGTQPAPRDLAGLRPVLTAHTALAASRGAVASGLRQALRELYPAALRAFGDPTKPIALAVLDALPDPVMLSRGQDGDAVTRIASTGRFDSAEAAEAVAALRTAATEAGSGRSTLDAVGITVRQAVAAVRACDTALSALLREVAERVEARTGQQSAAPAAAPAAAPPAAPTTPPATPAPPPRAPETKPAPPRLTPPAAGKPAASTPAAPVSPASDSAAPVSAAPVSAAPVSAAPVSASPVSAAPVSGTPVSGAPVSGAPVSGAPVAGAPAPVAGAPASVGRGTPAVPQIPQRTRPAVSLPPRARPAVSIPPIRPRQAPPSRPGGAPPAPPGGVAAFPTAGAPPEQKSAPPPPSVVPPAPRAPHPANTAKALDATNAPKGGGPAAPLSSPFPPAAVAPNPAPPAVAPPTDDPTTGFPAAQPQPQLAQRGRRQAQPDDTSDLELSMLSPDELPTHGNLLKAGPTAIEPNPPRTPPRDNDSGRAGNGRASRLSEIPMRGGRGGAPQAAPAAAAARPDPLTMTPPAAPPAPAPAPAPQPAPPASPPPMSLPSGVDASDEGLLIFAEARSAWFQHHDEKSPQRDWASASDEGWRAAEAAAEPTVGGNTTSGLPKRVPQANLVPGSAQPPPRREEAPPAVRDAATLAAHTAAYFRGWHRARPDEQREAQSRTFQPSSRAPSQS